MNKHLTSIDDPLANAWQQALQHLEHAAYLQAEPLLQQLAAQGYAQAQYKLATLYLTGRGVTQNPEHAHHWFTQAAHGLREAARWDDAEAQCRLGWMYSRGMGVPQDTAAAKCWLEQAAQQHHADAQYQLALLAQAEQHFTSAFSYLQQAAHRNHRQAQYRLGLAYLTGQGTAQDELKAADWLQRAAEQGVTAAQTALTTHNIALHDQATRASYQTDEDSGLELNPDFCQAFERMEHSRDSLFLTGNAGTGKSTLLTYFRARTQKNVVVLAPTGVAALNVNGETIHTFFRFPARPVTPDEIKPVSKKRQKLYRSLDTIIIDEVSMVRVDLLDAIDQFLRINGRNAEQPFGGIQLILIGDLFQLPPVVVGQEEKRLFETVYESPFFLSANVFQNLSLHFIELRRIYRQQAQTFIQILNAIRNNSATQQELMHLNQRYQPTFEPPEDTFYITLTTTNQRADQINEAALAKLAHPLHHFTCEATGIFEEKNAPAEWKLALKVKAQVMFVRNDVEGGRWVNGTLGRVKALTEDSIQVETDDGELHQVKPVKWEIFKYQFDEKTNQIKTEIVGTFSQYPLRLAWAITIHKSQGKTFDHVCIDLGRGTFAHGQLYVALSRCRTLDGLVLKTRVRARDVIVDSRLQQFLVRFNK